MKMRGKTYVDNTKESLTCLSLFSGYDGIGIGLEKALYPTKIKTVAHVEIEAYAVANLVKKMEAGGMVPAPIWSDIKTFNAFRFRDKVDILTGGYPCQPFSHAGKRKGEEDPRHLWPYVRDTIEAIQPKICFFENVEGHITLGLREVLTDLVKLGYSVENDCGEPTFGIFSAAEVGAPHQRKRVFILAHAKSWESGEQETWNGWKSVGGRSQQMAHAGLLGQTESKQQATGVKQCGSSLWPARPGEPQYEWEEPRTVADSKSVHVQGFKNRQGEVQPWGSGTGQVKSELGGTFNGASSGVDPNRNQIDRLRLLGNGVVPQTAERAFRVLWGRVINPDKSKVQPLQMELF